jgi:VacB/RNase II family 3'-5' exoribonuclease
MNPLSSIARRVMLQRGLWPDFSAAVYAETAAAGAATPETGPAVRDLRDLLWASIDNDDSLDLDQLTVADPMPGRMVKILVAVADVDAVVRQGSALDAHAANNTTSVYTAGGVFPMLPARLSTDLTSLGEGQDRLALVVEMVVDGEGEVRNSELYRASVKNRAKLAYASLAAWLEGLAPAPPRLALVPGLEAQLQLQDRVAQAMRGRRLLRGALGLQTPKAEAVFADGALKDLELEQPNRAKQLIEDFMVAANGATAAFLEQRRCPSLRRVLRSPERWGRLVALAEAHGDHLPAAADGEALAQFLSRSRRRDPARFPDLSLAVVKLLGRGEYALQRPGQAPQGHFALAVPDYTHATAPNRRFPDLVTQRLLKAALAAEPQPYTPEALEALARRCTEQEAAAAKVERQVAKSAAALLLASRVGERFDGLVTGASEKGTWVRITHPATEGRLVRDATGLDVGDRVRVQLTHTDVERGFIDFTRVLER